MLDRFLTSTAIVTAVALLTSAITVAEMRHRITDISQRIDALTMETDYDRD